MSYHLKQLKRLMFDNSLHIKIGKKIKEIRELKGISQQVLAAKCNFEKSNLSRLESGKVNSTISTLEKVSKALEIDIVELFTSK